MKRRWKILIGLIVLLIVVAIAWHISWLLEIDEYKKELVAKGEKLEISELLPPPVPPEQNGADILNKADSFPSPGLDWTNMPDMMRLIAPGKAIVCFEQPDIRNRYYTNSWSNVMTAVELKRPVIELLRQVINYPVLDFHLDYYGGPETVTKNYIPGYCAGTLSADAICDLRDQDAASAATNTCVMLAFVNGKHDERFLISQLTRMHITSLATEVNWELLQATNLSDSQLAMLQKSWERLEFIHAMENAVLMERARNKLTMVKMRASTKYLNSIVGCNHWDFSGDWSTDFDTIMNNAERGFERPMWHAWWTYSDELRMLQNDQIILEAIRAIETNGCYNPAYTDMMDRLVAVAKTQDFYDIDGLRWLFSNDSESTGYQLSKMMAAEVCKETVIAAIALKRYQLEYGKYPSDLNSLMPEFVASIPHDPVDGKPLRYRRNADGTFLLYSIGLNGTDDGGNPSLEERWSLDRYWPDPHTLDWVWPQPATAEEVDYFFKQSKQ